jgi:hypothetical protein
MRCRHALEHIEHAAAGKLRAFHVVEPHEIASFPYIIFDLPAARTDSYDIA